MAGIRSAARSGALSRVALVAALGLYVAAPPARGEVVEEIVAWVDGDIITMSELLEEEQAILQDLYRRYTGEELDREVRAAKDGLLMQMIDRKILLHRAGRMFDMERVGESYLTMFKQQQRIETDAELDALLAEAGMTSDELVDTLVERFAPEEVLRIEVGNRVAVGDAEIEAYYRANESEFAVAGEVTFREIVLLAEGEAQEGRRAEAEALHRLASEGDTDYTALVREHSEAGTAADDGKLGPFRRGDLAPKLEQAVFNVPVGEVGPLLVMPYGFHIVKIEQRSDDRIRSLDEVRDELKKRLEDEKYARELGLFLSKARDEADWTLNRKYVDRLPSKSQETP